MESLKELPEAKYAMDDLMKRTELAEEKYEDLKKISLRIIYKLLKNTSMLRIEQSGPSLNDIMQIKRKEDIISDLIKLLELYN